MYKFIVEGRLNGMNEFIAANRQSPKAGNRMKKEAEQIISIYIRKYLKQLKIDKLVKIHYTYYEPNKNRDKDNISGFFHKVCQDALVKCGVLTGDGWKEIKGFTDDFEVDKNKPRIEVIIQEIDK